MPVRFRRRRLLYICVLLIFFGIYWFNQNSEPLSDNVYAEPVEPVLKVKRSHFENQPESAPILNIPIQRKTREETVEINGKILKKIDWHDYGFIARENARVGNEKAVQFLNMV